MPNDATQTSPEQLLAKSISLRKRITRALNALDGGEDEAADDLSATARIALSNGDGDKVVLRLVSAFRVPMPQLMISPPPADKPHHGLAIGSLPDSPKLRGGEGKMVAFRDATTRAALISSETRSRKFSWAQLATEYGNTWGNHLSVHVPGVLSHVSLFEAAGTDLGHFVVRQMGLMAESALNQVHLSIDPAIETMVERSMYFRGAGISRITIDRFTPGKRRDFDIGASYEDDSLRTNGKEIALLQFSDAEHRYWIGFDENGMQLRGSRV